MNCSRCGGEVAEGHDFCGNCGARLAGYATPADMPTTTAEAAEDVAGATAGHPPSTPASQANAGAAYSFDARRWTPSDRIAGLATLVVLISLFLPWFSVNLAGLGGLGVGAGVVTESGTSAHGWLWFVFVVGLAILLYLLVAAGYQALPVNLPLKHERLLLAATTINFLLVLLAVALKPGSDGEPVKVGWAFGAVVALIAAIAAVVPLARTALNERNARAA
jgi:hypothetical protein